jgi:NACHT domain- and WD repeat-containing protein
LLEGLCKEISRRYGVDESDVPLDFRDLVPEFAKRMGLATGEKPLVIFLDSLDQLSSFQDARRLTWLPAELPVHVSMVISSRREKDIFPHLQQKNVIEKQLDGLDESDGRDLLKLWLEGVGRNLTDDQHKEVILKFKASKGNPLYLKLAFEEARLWPSGDGQPPKPLEPGIEGIIQGNMIPRLADEGNHGKAFLSHALGYLAASRNGLAEDELVDLLSRDIEVYEAFFRQTYHLPSDLVNLAVAYLKDHPQALENFPTESDHDAERLAQAISTASRTWLKQLFDQVDRAINYPPKNTTLKWRNRPLTGSSR